MTQRTIDERMFRLGFARPALGESFAANHGPESEAVSTEGERLFQLDTGWETGLRWFVVPEGASGLALLDGGTATRCDCVAFVRFGSGCPHCGREVEYGSCRWTDCPGNAGVEDTNYL